VEDRVLVSLLCTSSIILTVSGMLGCHSRVMETHAMAIWSISTISSSMLGYLRSLESNTSTVHSSRMIDRTHLTRWTVSLPPPVIWIGDLPVRSSNMKTPKLYTSEHCDAFLVSVTSGAQYLRVRDLEVIGFINKPMKACFPFHPQCKA
jgi:hypothetical protein